MRHQIVSEAEWTDHRREILLKEKKLTKMRDELAREIRAMPWMRMEKSYAFTGPNGKESLGDLFGNKSQLVVYHFMFGPEWEEGCPSCSFWADNFNGVQDHLAQRDVSFVAVSRGPFEAFDRYRKRLGWSFKWVSSAGTDFNFDMHVSNTPETLESGAIDYNFGKIERAGEEMPGLSIFHKNSEGIFRTYSVYARGLDVINGAYQMLDMVPKGRDEDDLQFTMAWLRPRDKYDSSQPRTEKDQ